MGEKDTTHFLEAIVEGVGAGGELQEREYVDG